MIEIKKFSIRSTSHSQFINITQQVQQMVTDSGISDGICVVFIPHTTAAVTINENTDPNVPVDIIHELNKVIPWADNYAHSEGNSAAHIKTSLIGASEVILVEKGRLVLGTWQSIFFCEFDGPRTRHVFVKIQ
ncbi:YjbQ family protein [candidate division KSB1 bacterium]|nr:YjbQ family protein [candidate division KSB1 bacterium]